MKECTICLDITTVEEQCKVCQWQSCENCRAEWAKYNNTCPGCRTELFPKEDLPPTPVDTRISFLVVCRLLFITIDVILFFVLFGLFTILLVEVVDLINTQVVPQDKIQMNGSKQLRKTDENLFVNGVILLNMIL